jgi:hypothetical protein
MLDIHARDNQDTQLQRTRHYDDELQSFDFMLPAETPCWTCIDQLLSIVYDTEYSEKMVEEDNSMDFNDDDDETEVLLTSNNTKNYSKSGST